MSEADTTRAPKRSGMMSMGGRTVLAKLGKVLPSAGPGALGGLLSTLCCALPAAALAIGLTGGLAAAFVSLGRFRLYGIIAGLVFVAIAAWFSLRRARSCCTPEEYRRRQIAIPLTMFASFGLVYGVTMYLIVPLLYRMG